MGRVTAQHMSAAQGAMLLGRRTYENFADTVITPTGVIIATYRRA